MTFINLKDELFSVPISPDHKKQLKYLLTKLQQFNCILNGNALAMRVFTN